TNTAIVLPDDSMLLPVLNSLPENINAVNITMGYAFKHSKIYILFELMRDLMKNSKSEGEKTVYYHKDVLSVLLNPLIKQSFSKEADEAIETINRRNIIYVSGKFLNDFLNDGICGIIFRACS